MAFSEAERQYLRATRLGRLATADSAGRPHVVPVCFAVVGADLVTPLDEKPKQAEPGRLRRVRDIEENPRVAMVCDHWREDWSELGWLQVRGTASLLAAGRPDHNEAVGALRDKYEQYADHRLEDRPVIRLEVGSVVSWGQLRRDHAGSS